MHTGSFYKKIIAQLQVGYACQKVIFDDNNNPVNFELLEVNKEFENIAGKKSSEIVGKNAKTIFPMLLNEKFDWTSFLEGAVINNTTRKTEQYFEHSKKWYEVIILPVNNQHIVTYLSDITKEKEKELSCITLETIPVPAFRLDKEEKNIKFNKAFEEYIGLPASKITFDKIYEIEERAKIYNQNTADFLYNTDLQKTEWSFINYKDKECHAILYKTPFEVKNNKTKGFTILMTDITQTKLNEKTIQEQKRISKVFKEFSMDLASVPISQNIFRFICHTIKKNTGASTVSINTFHEATDELEYQYSTLSENADKNTLRELNRNYKGLKFKPTPQLNDLINKESIIKAESITDITFDRNPTSRGKIFNAIFGNEWVSATGLFFEGKLIGSIIHTFDKKSNQPANEELEALAGVCSNAVRRWMTETSLLEEEMQFRKLIASMQQGLALFEVILDDNNNPINCKYLKVNEAYEKLTGLKNDEIIGKIVTEVSPSVDKQWIEEHCQVAITGNPLNYEYFHETYNKHYEVVAYRPGPGLFAIILTDISERKRSEELRKKVELAQRSVEFKQNFLANMSHEIRTPLTGIMGMAEILSKTRLDPQQQDYLNTIRFSTGNLKKIIDQILDYSKIEAGKITLQHSVFETNELLTNAEKLFESICKKDVELIINKSPDLPDYLETDPQRIFQVINNLLFNAVKFTEEGTITINIYPDEWIDDQNLMVKIEVIDTGIGIKPESQEQLFKPFSQLYTDGIRRFEGTGLGLSICKEITTQLGGKIDVKSEPQKGSMFWFTFKAKLVAKPAETKGAKKQKSSELKQIELKILHVEDKIVNQRVVTLILESLGHKVKTAKDGEQALKMFENEKFDIILMDIHMPVMDGITATKELRKKYSSLPPIIGLSANSFEGDREKYINLGMDDYLNKPVQEDDFIKIIKEFNL